MKPRLICADCPDLEACHTGASCEYVRGVEAFFTQYDKNLKGKTKMTAANAKKTTVTASDVVDQAVEEKLVVVPSQNEGEKTVGEPDEQDKVSDDDKSDEGVEKKSLKSRLLELTSKVKENKKALGATVAVVGIVTYSVVKYVKKAAQDVLDEEIITDDSGDLETVPTADAAV
jgi:hypothetical protein